jgi:hypothetical protein
MAPAASADRTECVGVLTGTFDNVTVPPGSGLLADECRGAAQHECPRGREALFPLRGDRQQSSGRRSGVRADFTLGAGPPNTVGNNILLAGGSDFVAVCDIQVGRNVLIQEWTARGIVVGEMRSASSSARCSVGEPGRGQHSRPRQRHGSPRPRGPPEQRRPQRRASRVSRKPRIRLWKPRCRIVGAPCVGALRIRAPGVVRLETLGTRGRTPRGGRDPSGRNDGRGVRC